MVVPLFGVWQHSIVQCCFALCTCAFLVVGAFQGGHGKTKPHLGAARALCSAVQKHPPWGTVCSWTPRWGPCGLVLIESADTNVAFCSKTMWMGLALSTHRTFEILKWTIKGSLYPTLSERPPHTNPQEMHPFHFKVPNGSSLWRHA